MGLACNVFQNIDPDFIVHHFVHGGELCNFRLSSIEGQFKSFRRLVTVPGCCTLQFFYKSGGSPLYSFNIVAMLLSMWVPPLQAYSRQGQMRVM